MTEIDALKEIIRLQAEEIAYLKARISELERRLGINSTTSSKPPSSDGLRKKPSPQSLREKTTKKSGGQEGHKGTTLEQVLHVDHTVVHSPSHCLNCGSSLEYIPADSTSKRQVFDIVKPILEVTEHVTTTKQCACGHHTRASFPENVKAPVQYGPTIKANVLYLKEQHLLPEDRLSDLCKDLFGLSLSASTIASMSADFAQRIAPEREMTLSNLKESPVKHLDETGFRIGGKTCWLHVISTDTATHYRVSTKRKNLLEEMKGILVHDHWLPYFSYCNPHALCNAHHLRELKALKVIEKESWAFKMWDLLLSTLRLKDPSNEKKEQVSRIYDQIVRRGLRFHEAQTPLFSTRRPKRRPGHNLLIRLRDFKECVLRFLKEPDVPFTNNQAEQDIRMMKLKQKISGGFRSFEGADTFCAIRGFLSTCRKNGINLLGAVQEVLSKNSTAST